MKVVLKFKDGMAVTQDLGEEAIATGDGNFFKLMLEGKAKNLDITIDQAGKENIVRKYADLYSIECIL